jgi:uncharacterized membrane protein
MNAAHLHVTLVHIPVVVVPLGAAILAVGLARRNSAVSSTALSILLLAAIIAVPAFLLGEGAEEIVEHLPGVSEDLIEEHEEAADIALWLTVASGLLSLSSLVACKLMLSWSKRAMIATLPISIAAASLLSYAAFQGGKIRHPEAYESARGSAEPAELHDH